MFGAESFFHHWSVSWFIHDIETISPPMLGAPLYVDFGETGFFFKVEPVKDVTPAVIRWLTERLLMCQLLLQLKLWRKQVTFGYLTSLFLLDIWVYLTTDFTVSVSWLRRVHFTRHLKTPPPHHHQKKKKTKYYLKQQQFGTLFISDLCPPLQRNVFSAPSLVPAEKISHHPDKFVS